MHDYNDLIAIFNDCFALDYNTQLLKGSEEPIYLPAGEGQDYNALYFAHGFFSSALHECSHWLIAGEARRKQIDFGYWYVPDGRTREQQALFLQVEVKPQALEWILSMACGHGFRVSIDNLNSQECMEREVLAFKKAVYNQVLDYCEWGLPERAARFYKALCEFYKQPNILKEKQFVFEIM